MDISDFEIGELIGAGGLGEVFAARQKQTGRDVVVKRALTNEHQTYARTRDEGRLGIKLNGTAFVETLGYFDDDAGVPHVVVERIHGVTVADLLRRTGAPSYAAVAKIGQEIAQALAVLHILRDAEGKPLNAMHRDIGARNVMVDLAGNVRVLDLGAAFSTAEDRSAATKVGVIIGTISYMPPEVFEQRPDTPARDIWSLGVLLLESSVARPYLRARENEEDNARMKRTWKQSRDPFASKEVQALDPRLLRILKQMLVVDPAKRLDAKTVAAELGALLAGSHPQQELAAKVRLAQQLPAGAPKPRSEGVSPPPTPAGSTSLTRTEPELAELVDDDALDLDAPTVLDPRAGPYPAGVNNDPTHREPAPGSPSAPTLSLPEDEPTPVKPWLAAPLNAATAVTVRSPAAPATPPVPPGWGTLEAGTSDEVLFDVDDLRPLEEALGGERAEDRDAPTVRIAVDREAATQPGLVLPLAGHGQLPRMQVAAASPATPVSMEGKAVGLALSVAVTLMCVFLWVVTH